MNKAELLEALDRTRKETEEDSASHFMLDPRMAAMYRGIWSGLTSAMVLVDKLDDEQTIIQRFAERMAMKLVEHGENIFEDANLTSWDMDLTLRTYEAAAWHVRKEAGLFQ